MRRSRTFLLCLAVQFPALAPLSAATADDPSSVYLHGLIEERFGRPMEALGFYERAAALDPSSRFLQETLADLLLQLGRLDEALAAATRAAALAGSDPGAAVLLGRVHMARGDRAAALSAFDAALAQDPSHGEALLYAAYMRASADPAASIAFLERYINENPGTSQPLMRIAELHESLRDFAAAEATWRRALERDDSNPDIHAALGRLAEARGDLKGAVASYEAARFLTPDDPRVLAPLGDLYFRLGRRDDARDTLESAVRAQPGNTAARFGLALLAEERGEWDEAVRHMSVAAAASDVPAVSLRLAYEYSMAERPADALKVLRKLHDRYPDSAETLLYLGLAYEDLGKHKPALKVFQALADRDPSRADAQFHIGVNWDGLGKFAKAEPYLLRAIELRPDHAVALNYLGYSWSDRGVRLDEAEKFIRRALKKEPGSSAYEDSLGWCLFKQGRLEEAAALLSRVALAAEDAVVWEHYGDVLSAQGRKDEAARAWEEGLLADPGQKSLRRRLKGRADEWTVSPMSAARSTLKRVEVNFMSLSGAAGSVGVAARLGGRAVDSDGVFYYRKPDALRLEILGALWVPQAVVVRNAAGLRAAMGEGEQALPPQVEAWLDALAGILSGSTTKAFDNPTVRVKRKGSVLTYRGDGVALEIDGRRKLLTGWSGEGLAIRFDDYREIDGVWWPGVIRLEAAGGRASVSLSFRTPRMNPKLEDSLFRSLP